MMCRILRRLSPNKTVLHPRPRLRLSTHPSPARQTPILGVSFSVFTVVPAGSQQSVFFLSSTRSWVFSKRADVLWSARATQIIDYIAMLLSQTATTHPLHRDEPRSQPADIRHFRHLGWFAKREHGWAWLVGMALYLIDTGIMVWIKYWPGLIFHIIALVSMLLGYIAMLRKRKLLNNSPSCKP